MAYRYPHIYRLLLLHTTHANAISAICEAFMGNPQSLQAIKLMRVYNRPVPVNLNA